jgi:DNA-binding XRE family transcriptional regulator
LNKILKYLNDNLTHYEQVLYNDPEQSLEGKDCMMTVVKLRRRRERKGRLRIVHDAVETSGKIGGSGAVSTAPDRRAQTLGTLVREHREEHACSQQEFAEIAGISRTTLSNIERGYVFPSARIRRKLAEAMGVSPKELWHASRSPDHSETASLPNSRERYQKAL